jgi:ethanolamine utilization protein EutN
MNRSRLSQCSSFVFSMLLARVTGTVVSTAKDPSLAGKKLLVLQPIDGDGNDRGAKLIAVDSVGAGAGETVYYCRGREASFPWYPDEVPTDSTIVGIIDRVNVQKKSGVRSQN